MQIKKRKKMILVIGDVHAPYYDMMAMKKIHKLYIQLLKEYSDVTVVQSGDLTDQTAWSRFPKDPDAPGATDEWESALDSLVKIQRMFPQLAVITGNHDSRHMKKALEVGIPSRLIKTLDEEIGCEGWTFHKPGLVELGNNIGIIHGDELPVSGTNALTASRLGMNLLYGHTHLAGIQYNTAMGRTLWQCNVGCVVDQSAIAFRYAAKNPMRSFIGVCLVEVDLKTGASFPTIIPASQL